MNRFKVITRKQANSMLEKPVEFTNAYVIWDSEYNEWCFNASTKKANQDICDGLNLEEHASAIVVKVKHLTLIKGGLAA